MTGLDVNDALQAPPQLMPSGLDETVPPPVPFLLTLRVALAQTPPEQVGVGQAQATGFPHCPPAVQISTELPRQRRDGGAQTPVQTPFTHT